MDADEGPPVHPGLIVAEAIRALGVRKVDVAAVIGMNRSTLHKILTGRAPITPTVAVKIGKLLGNGGRKWCVLQAGYDVWLAEQRTDVSGITTLVGRDAPVPLDDY